MQPIWTRKEAVEVVLNQWILPELVRLVSEYNSKQAFVKDPQWLPKSLRISDDGSRLMSDNPYGLIRAARGLPFEYGAHRWRVRIPLLHVHQVRVGIMRIAFTDRDGTRSDNPSVFFLRHGNHPDLWTAYVDIDSLTPHSKMLGISVTTTLFESRPRTLQSAIFEMSVDMDNETVSAWFNGVPFPSPLFTRIFPLAFCAPYVAVSGRLFEPITIESAE